MNCDFWMLRISLGVRGFMLFRVRPFSFTVTVFVPFPFFTVTVFFFVVFVPLLIAV
jgi:hypothetical protein